MLKPKRNSIRALGVVLFLVTTQFVSVLKLMHDDEQLVESIIVRSHSKKKTSRLKIVGFSDYVYIDAAKMWYDKLTSLGYEEHVVVAVDNETLDELKSENYRVEPYFTAVVRGNRKSP
jgi:hypothetical protein